MPYIFGFLVAANVAMFGYYWFFPVENQNTVDVAKAQLQKPLNYQNNTANMPPLIGEKK